MFIIKFIHIKQYFFLLKKGEPRAAEYLLGFMSVDNTLRCPWTPELANCLLPVPPAVEVDVVEPFFPVLRAPLVLAAKRRER